MYSLDQEANKIHCFKIFEEIPTTQITKRTKSLTDPTLVTVWFSGIHGVSDIILSPGTPCINKDALHQHRYLGMDN